MATPSLAMIPSAYADSKVYSVLPNNGDGDFTFDRASTATRFAQNGLIETVATDIPRLNYDISNGVVQSCPSLLLEPASTNLVTYSEDLSNSAWGKQNGGTGSAPTVTSNYSVSPDGTQNADRVIFNLNGGTANADVSQLAVTIGSVSSANYSNSVYIKSNTANDYALVITEPSGSFHTKTITNQWQRFDASSSNATNVSFRIRLRGEESTSDYADVSIWGAQIEQGSYATSYIPTQGSAVTRVADNTKIVNSPILQATNQFTLFFDAKDFVITFGNIMLNLGAGENAYDAGGGIHIFSNYWYYWNGSSAVGLGLCYNATTDSKFAIAYDGTKFTRYANGVKLGTTTTSASMSNWDTLTNGVLSHSGVDRVFDLADLKLYNTALSDSELATLTTI